MKFAEEFENVISFILKCDFDVSFTIFNVFCSQDRKIFNSNCMEMVTTSFERVLGEKKTNFWLFLKFDVIMTSL